MLNRNITCVPEHLCCAILATRMPRLTKSWQPFKNHCQSSTLRIEIFFWSTNWFWTLVVPQNSGYIALVIFCFSFWLIKPESTTKRMLDSPELQVVIFLCNMIFQWNLYNISLVICLNYSYNCCETCYQQPDVSATHYSKPPLVLWAVETVAPMLCC